MTIQELRNQLKASVEIKENTFEHFNLKLTISYKLIDNKDISLYILRIRKSRL